MHITPVVTSKTSMRCFALMRGGNRICPGQEDTRGRTDESDILSR